MPLRQLVAVGLWLCVTASATAIVWTGTSTVAADLTDRPPPVVAHRDVVTALQSGSSAANTEPGITTPNANSSTTTLPPDGPGSAATPDTPVSGQTRSPRPGLTTAAPAAPTTRASSPPTTQPSSPPTTQAPARPTATYSTAGGVVTVACNGYFLIELLAATPNNGFAVNVVTAGPYYVEVHFVRGGQDQPIWAFCLGQPIRAHDGPPRGGQPPGSP